MNLCLGYHCCPPLGIVAAIVAHIAILLPPSAHVAIDSSTIRILTQRQSLHQSKIYVSLFFISDHNHMLLRWDV